MTKFDDVLTKMREKEDKTGKFLQLVVLTTKDKISYEFFGTPIDISRIDSELKGVMFGPTIEKEGAIEYLRSGSKYLYEGMEGEGAWSTDHGPWPGALD